MKLKGCVLLKQRGKTEVLIHTKNKSIFPKLDCKKQLLSQLFPNVIAARLVQQINQQDYNAILDLGW